MENQEIVTEESLRGQFRIALVVSCAWILLATVMHFEFWLQVVVPLVTMARYWHVFSSSHGKDKYVHMFADSMYFLGFILTVASLICSLLPFVLGETDPSPEALLGRFGVALTTTLLGIIARTYTVNFLPDQDDLDEQARLGVREQSAILRKEMENTVKDFEEFNEGLGENLATLKKNLEENVATLYESSMDSVNEMMVQAQKRIEESMESFSRALEESMRQSSGTLEESMRDAYRGLRESMEESSGLLEKSLERTVSSVDSAAAGLADKLENIEIDPRSIRDGVVQSFSGISEELGKVSELVGQSHVALSEGLGRIRASIDGTVEIGAELQGLRDAGESLKSVSTGLDELTGNFKNLHRAIDGAISGSSRIGEKVEAQARSVQRFIAQTDLMTEKLEEYLASMDSVVAGFAEQNQGLGEVREGMKREVDAMQGETQRYFNALRGASDEYAQALQDIGGYLARTMRDVRRRNAN